MKRAIRNWRHSPPFRNNGFHAEEEGEGGILARLNRIRVKYDYLALPPPLCRASGRDSPRSNEPPESFRRPLHCDTASPPRRPPVFSTSLCSCVSGLRAILPSPTRNCEIRAVRPPAGTEREIQRTSASLVYPKDKRYDTIFRK